MTAPKGFDLALSVASPARRGPDPEKPVALVRDREGVAMLLYCEAGNDRYGLATAPSSASSSPVGRDGGGTILLPTRLCPATAGRARRTAPSCAAPGAICGVGLVGDAGPLAVCPGDLRWSTFHVGT